MKRVVFLIVLLVQQSFSIETLYCQTLNDVVGFEAEVMIKPSDVFELTYGSHEAKFNGKTYQYESKVSIGLLDVYLHEKKTLILTANEYLSSQSNETLKALSIRNVENRLVFFKCRKKPTFSS